MATFGERMIGAMKLDANTFEEIERDPAALGQAVTVIVIAAVSSGIGNIWRIGVTPIVGGVIGTLIAYLIWTGIVFLVATKVMPAPGTKSDFKEALRVLGFAAAPGVFYILAIIPFLGPIIGFFVWVWTLIVMVVAVRQAFDYTDTFKALLVCVIGFIGFIIAYMVIALPLMGGSMLFG